MMKEQSLSEENTRETLLLEIKAVMVDYIIKTNSWYHANEFTSSQLAKKVIAETEMGKTKFPIIHHLIKETLKEWEEQGFCTHISRTKYSRCRKTKDTYRFKTRGILEIKKRAIDETIRTINNSELTTAPIMRTRDYIIRDRLEGLLNSANKILQPTESRRG
jgi:hypothetical protein